ncbi:NADPH-dependent FMN reductase [Plesiocystis pacifica SIR-1]|uniref:NADPH-dependent FMN reductase n=1 Tax=Plesiocystis pacifica SIR-1 TaxID=391625 RepID=A6FZP9_9BACT|nr:NAD(P)H-dependent oxidoreductase [Plesiocystis pacifica]EDM80855.1 NADPH-dependent FMN reductase [Plesiocystis pacifica SIR-1]
MKLLVFAASAHSTSINRRLAEYAARTLAADASLDVPIEIERLDLNDYEMPLFTQDREAQLGSPPQAQAFLDAIARNDAVVVSFAEHNGSYTVAYKNVFDWASRIDNKVYQGRPMVLLATSPGGRGGASVLGQASASLPYQGGEIVASVSVPRFHANFDADTDTLTQPELRAQVEAAMRALYDATKARLNKGP